jgi:hypothetical protein
MGRKKTKPEKKPAYQYKVGEVVIYVGCLYEEYKDQECTIVEHSKTHKLEYYKIQFWDGIIRETTINAIKRKEINNEDNRTISCN